MKWYNKDNTRCVDLSKVGYWDFSPQQNNGFMLIAALFLSVEGYEVSFTGDDAKEIYELLTQEKQLLEG